MDISFQYDNGNRETLNNVSVSPESGERVGLVALNGSGKMTFCKMLADHEKPDHGTVVLDRKNTSSCAGYNPAQTIRQHPELSVNPRFKMWEVLREGDFVEERVVHSLGIEPDWLNRYPGELSGGELQWFCVAKALGKRTRFILTNEVGTTLDLITQSQIWGFLLGEVKTRDLGLLVANHLEELLERVYGKMVNLRMNQG